MIISSAPKITHKQEAVFITAGLVTIGVLGVIAAAAVCFAALWVVFQFATLCMQSIVECSTAIGTTFAGSDPLVRTLLLIVIGYSLYRIGKRIFRR